MNRNYHQVPVETISTAEIWNNSQFTLIDTRSESEFAQGSIPDAINIPLLSDDERAIIGILYKHEGQNSAIEKGYELFEPKIQNYLNQFSALPSSKPIAVYCARGGMRSQIICSFLNRHGYSALQLEGGYKSFRQWNLKKLEEIVLNDPVVLHGQTGVGKTLVLERMDNVLDLEGLADHRGSMFGGIGKSPVSQKNFEAALLRRVEALDNSRPIYIEGESRRIGKVSIPATLFEQMKSARLLLLEASINTRVERTVHEYIDLYPDTIPTIRYTIQQLKPDLGAENVNRLLDRFDKGDYAWCFEFILLNYYDKKYNHALKQMNFELTVSTEDLAAAATRIQSFCEQRHNQVDQVINDRA